MLLNRSEDNVKFLQQMTLLDHLSKKKKQNWKLGPVYPLYL